MQSGEQRNIKKAARVGLISWDIGTYLGRDFLSYLIFSLALWLAGVEVTATEREH